MNQVLHDANTAGRGSSGRVMDSALSARIALLEQISTASAGRKSAFGPPLLASEWCLHVYFYSVLCSSLVHVWPHAAAPVQKSLSELWTPKESALMQNTAPCFGTATFERFLCGWMAPKGLLQGLLCQISTWWRSATTNSRTMA